MDKSFIYSDLGAESLSSLGWFQPKVAFQTIADDANYVKHINDCMVVNSNTLIAYFPGCFAQFHIGHLDVVKQAIKHCKSITDNYLVVIAPANSDYTTEKYGKDSLFATNKYRYDRICSMLNGIEGNVAIDLNTMLNFKVDYNFTDLIYDFISRQNINYNDLTRVPKIICGKDRDYFSNLVKLTDKIDVFYVEDTTGASSSAHINSVKNNKLPKKKLIIRGNDIAEYDLFKKYFVDQYESIEYCSLINEINAVKDWHNKAKFDITICKDYAGFLPYVKVNRRFDNPLSSGDGHITEGPFDGLKVIDSDIFSGGTKAFIEKNGGKLFAHHDLMGHTDGCELLDIPDFYNEKFCYPYVDISSRCSMQAFDLDAHNNFMAFKDALRNLRG